jgi:hypothetical protein
VREFRLGLAAAAADRQVGRADAPARAGCKELLDTAILERVERDRRQRPARAQQLPGQRQGGVELVELVIDGDPDRLERALGGVAASEARGRRHGGLDHLDELECRDDRRALALGDDCSGDLGGEAFLAELAQQSGQPPLIPNAHDLSRGQLLIGVHPHVQWRVVGVGEPALPSVDLHRRGAEIEVDAVGADALVEQQREPVGEAGPDETRGAADLARELLEALLRRGVSIPISVPLEPIRSAIRRAWPPPPTVQSTASEPGCGSSSSISSPARTGTWLIVISSSVATR